MESIESDRGRLDVKAAHSAADMANLDLTNARRRSFSEPLKEFKEITIRTQQYLRIAWPHLLTSLHAITPAIGTFPAASSSSGEVEGVAPTDSAASTATAPSRSLCGQMTLGTVLHLPTKYRVIHYLGLSKPTEAKLCLHNEALR